jgi:hypothetical protein
MPWTEEYFPRAKRPHKLPIVLSQEEMLLFFGHIRGRRDKKVTRPAFELAGIFRRYGDAYRETHELPLQQKRAMRAIEVCRTAAWGGHVEKCGQCDLTRIAYNSCRNRHCPKCQNSERADRLENRKAELLPVEYFHVVFTIPEAMARIAFYNKEVVCSILSKAASETPLTIARDPKHPGAEIGFFAILSTRCEDGKIDLSWIRLTMLLRLWSMGTEPAASSPCPLHGPRRGSQSGLRSLDRL